MSVFTLTLICAWGFLGSSAVKESACNVEAPSSIPGSGRSARKGNGYPLQYSGLENSMDYIFHRVSKSRTRLNDFHFHFNMHILWLTFMYPFPYTSPLPSGYGISASWQPEQRGKVTGLLASPYLTKPSLLQ